MSNMKDCAIDHISKHLEESRKQDAQRSIFDEH